MTIARHLIIHGRVQGVWFRGWTVDVATELGLAGWVRNRRDGTVEMLVQGEADAVRRMIDRVHAGPPAAYVERVDVKETEGRTLSGFRQRRTA